MASNTWATFVRKWIANIFQKSPSLVTLINRDISLGNRACFNYWSENSHLLHKGKYHCTMADLLFDRFGFNLTSKYVSNSTQTKQLNPNKNRGPDIQLYFPLRSKWVFYYLYWCFLSDLSPLQFLVVQLLLLFESRNGATHSGTNILNRFCLPIPKDLFRT